jgi:hypothetical protein
VTPPNSPGFTAHYDTHDVFVLQLAGRKTWRIDAPPIALPHRSQPFAPQDYAPPPEPWGELELAAGDLLYLPRGWVHSTRTSDGFSAHVTLGVSVYTWVDLVSELMQAVINAPELRCALPPGFASREELRTQLKDTLGSVIDGLGHRVDRDRLLDAFTARVRASRARPSGRFRCDVSDVTLETTLQAARKPVISQDGEHCIVELDGRRILLPRGVTPMLNLMFDSAMPFRESRFLALATAPGDRFSDERHASYGQRSFLNGSGAVVRSAPTNGLALPKRVTGIGDGQGAFGTPFKGDEGRMAQGIISPYFCLLERRRRDRVPFAEQVL